jgi:hypothetical protein
MAPHIVGLVFVQDAKSRHSLTIAMLLDCHPLQTAVRIDESTPQRSRTFI